MAIEHVGSCEKDDNIPVPGFSASGAAIFSPARVHPRKNLMLIP
jgi:hypothetical protein